ncbi:MAG: aspartate kinase [Bdellovibrionaceae bacterium]|nr:aspartate kinase [Bdellovibrio sp.]
MTNPPKPKLIVQKYGGATLADPEKIKHAARRICDLHKSGTQVVAVVSAMGQTTNQLIDLAKQVSPHPHLRELDMLLTVGERISMSLLSMALNDLGCSAISLTGSQAGILTDENHVNARIIDVKGFRVEEALTCNKVVILAGFQGVSPVTKEITTLGRGGSDTSAVAMAGYLNADRCEILKDVDCVFTADPKIVTNAHPIKNLNYKQLIEMTNWGAKVLHHQSVEMAQAKNVKLYVGSAANAQSQGTLITSDFKFAKHQAVAVNSFANVFEIQINADIDVAPKQFLSLLNQSNIGRAQFLHSENNTHFITAPEETMHALKAFEAKQDLYKIIKNDIAAISVTYSEAVNDADLQQAEKKLSEEKIKNLKSFALMYSLHFFVTAEQKNAAIKALHSFI